MLYVTLAAVGVLAMFVGRFSARLRTMPVSPPLLALALGVVIGPVLLGLARVPAAEEQAVMGTATRLLLAVALMAIALRYPVEAARQRVREVAILVIVVMPAMAAAVGGAALALLGVPMAIAAALGAALSPTDPVLASSAVAGEPAEGSIPARLRQVLSLESGVNDGLALPLVMLASAMVTGSSWAADFGSGLLKIGVGLVIGIAVGGSAGALMRMHHHEEMERSALLLYTVLLALTVLGLVDVAHGDALVGVFAAGLSYNHLATGRDRRVEAEIDEGMNAFLVLPVFMLFGMVLPWQEWLGLGWRGLVFAVAALVVRRLPWAMALRRALRLRWHEAVWLGWYGPIGVAAIFYLTHLRELGVTEPLVWEAGTLVVAASTLAHGITSGVGPGLFTLAGDAAVDRRS